MHPVATHESALTEAGTEVRARLASAIERAAHLLPAQGPITIFVHHNTLHAFEEFPFHEAVQKGARVFGCQPYLAESRYREALGLGRIRFSELKDVLKRDLGDRAEEVVVGGVTLRELRLAMLEYPLRTGPAEELLWYVAEADALRKVREEVSAVVRSRMIAETRRWVMRDLRRGADPTLADGDEPGSEEPGPVLSPGLSALLDRHGEADLENWTDRDWEGFTLQALWRVCFDGVRDLPPFSAPPVEPIRHRDPLFEATGVDADAPVNDLLTRFCASYLDQGLAHWALPGREEGFFRAFLRLYRRPVGPPDRWSRGLAEELGRLDDAGVDPLSSIAESLEALGVSASEWDAYLSATFLALRGWGGMVRQTEVRGDRVVNPSPPGSLVGMLAIRLLLDRFSLTHVAREALGYDGPLSGLRAAARKRLTPHWPPGPEPRAFTVFQLAQILGLSPDVLHGLGPLGWSKLLREIESFSALERRRIFHMAYERRFYDQTLEALALHAGRKASSVDTPRVPRFQAVFCIDEREESIRRHLEEVAPDASTYATAGFFSVAMYYRGAADAHFVPLCPPVVRPSHYVVEEVEEDLVRAHKRRARFRKALGLITH
ncbi:MAG: putative inorganic carbon transporter subunit DabA, partial [Isosphaeraceae bacterium]